MSENKVGRPKKYTNVEEVEEIIKKYFKECKDDRRPYTMSGLAYALDMDRKTLLNYSKDEKFFPTIKKAKDFVEQSLEEKLISTSGVATGIIFNLKNNYDWKDKQEIDADVKTEIRVDLDD